MRRRAIMLLAVAVAAPLACAAPGTPGPAEPALTGAVTYRERVLLPPTSTLTVSLEEVSVTDAPSKVVAEQTRVIGPSAPPYPFRVKYAPSWIDPARRYAVRAEIRDPDGRLRFTTAAHPAVLTQGAPGEIDLVLEEAR